jgi:hypothetical protein
MVPRQTSDTSTPELPNCLYFMVHPYLGHYSFPFRQPENIAAPLSITAPKDTNKKGGKIPPC